MIQWQLTNNLFRRWINSKGSIPYIYRNTYVSTNESNVRFWNNCKRLSIACQFEIIAIAIFANISHGKNIFQQNIVSLFTLRRRIILRFPRSKSAVDVSILVVYSQKERDKRPVAVISVQPYQPSSKRACFLSNFDRVNNRSQLVISIDAWVEGIDAPPNDLSFHDPVADDRTEVSTKNLGANLIHSSLQGLDWNKSLEDSQRDETIFK